MDNLRQFTFSQKDYAQREDFQDEADPMRREIKIYWIYRISRSGRRVS